MKKEKNVSSQKLEMKKLIEILNQEEYSDYIGIKDKTLIDIGCGDGRSLLEIHSNKFGFIEFHALDSNFIGKSLDEIYKIFFNEYISINGGGHIPTLHQQIFPALKNHFHFHQTDLENLNKNDFEEYNLIILSNVLHLFTKEKANELLIFFVSKLSDKGLIFIKVANENHKGWEEERENYGGPKWGLTKMELRNLVKEMNVKYEENGDYNRQIILEK